MPDPEGGAKPEAALSAVSIKLPPFWPQDPELWFTQVEAQFLTRGVTTEQTKFAYVVASLQPEVAQEIRDILLNPPDSDQYKTIRKELIHRTSQSQQRRLHQLIIAEELGDRKPSQLLRKMQQLSGDVKMDDKMLRQLFLQRMPTNVQAILASSSDSVKIEELASLADKILEVTPTLSHVSHVAASPVYNPPAPPTGATAAPSTTDELKDLVKALTLQVGELTKTVEKMSRGRSQSRSNSPSGRSRSQSPREVPSDSDLCWYHYFYGKRARKCTAPCNFTKGNNATGQSNTNADS